MPISTSDPVPLPGGQQTGPNPGFAIYVHWPFCLAKCPYCDFNSHVREAVDQKRWAKALVRELEYFAGLTGPKVVTSIFFGGGTPSLMKPETVSSVLSAIARCWTLAGDAEITLEANPTSVDTAGFAAVRSAGVNRLSLGVQALNDADLAALGRWHSTSEAMSALEVARTHFPRTSFDLIYGRAGQTPAAWREELGQALDLARGHLSLYQLTVEPGTAFHREQREGRLVLPAQDDGARMLEDTWAMCARHGYQAYEVSNFAVPGEECRHNITYWRYGEYVGVGPGAHGRIRIDGVPHSTAQRRSPDGWLSGVERHGHGTETSDPLTPGERAAECLIMGLRTREGVSSARFEKIVGLPLEKYLPSDVVAEFIREGLIDLSKDYLRATTRGLPLLDSLLTELVAD